MSKTNFLRTTMAGSALLLVLGAWQGGAQSPSSLRQTSYVLGQSLPDLNDVQKQIFDLGLKSFSKTEVRADGLGLVFNGTTCAECHKAGAIGGAGIDLSTARVSRIGGYRNGKYSDLPELGGPVIQARSLKEFDSYCPIEGEVVPREADFVSRRITTPLFGVGLIEAIPAETILAATKKRDQDGVQGVANIVFNPETSLNEVGRFGWKAQHSSLHVFAGDAYLNEMGITSAGFPTENLPQGRRIPAGWDSVADPEDQDGDIETFSAFMRYLAPPGQRLPITPQVQSGERLFDSIRCTACHTPEMKTGKNDVAALSEKPVRLFSDLLLHRMGTRLADGIQQEKAQGDQFKTAPLWGLSRRLFFLHDGRAKSIEEAIANHEGESQRARYRYLNLRPSDRDALLSFLKSL